MVKFMPELMTLMVDTALQQVTHRLKETAPTPRMPPDTFRSQLDKQAAMLIASAYALHLAEQKDFPSLAHLLPIIASVFSSEDVQLPDGFLHHIGCLLCESAEVLREDLGELILKDFYLACCCADEGLLYTCRFLWLVGDKVPRALLDEVLKEMGSRSQVGEGRGSGGWGHAVLLKDSFRAVLVCMCCPVVAIPTLHLIFSQQRPLSPTLTSFHN